MIKHVRPSKKKVAELKKEDKEIPTIAELQEEEKGFKKILRKLDHLIRRKRVSKDYKDDILDHKAIKRKAKRKFSKIVKKTSKKKVR